MAAEDKMDMSLSDIIKQDRQQRGGSGGRGRGGRGGSGRGRGGVGGGGGGGGVGHFGGPTRGGGYGGPVRYRGRGRAMLYGRPKWHHDDFNASAGGSGGGGWSGNVDTGGKLVVSNLHFDVCDSDIVELFSSVGTLKKAAVREDQYGKSLGVADVHFKEREDALEAIKQYDGWTLDGRAMHIQLMDPQFERQRRPPMQGVNKRGGWNRFDGNFGGMQNMSRSQRRRSQWPQQAGISAKKLDAQIDAYHDMMDTS